MGGDEGSMLHAVIKMLLGGVAGGFGTRLNRAGQQRLQEWSARARVASERCVIQPDTASARAGGVLGLQEYTTRRIRAVW
jgi:hypothetical protein